MLRLKFYLGLLPLLLLLVLVGLAGIYVCDDLARSSAEKVRHGSAMMTAAQEMIDAATAVDAALHQSLDGRAQEARPVYERERAHFKRVLLEESFDAKDLARAQAIARVKTAFEHLEQIADPLILAQPAQPAQTRAQYDEAEKAFNETVRTLDDLLVADARELKTESERLATIAHTNVRRIEIAIIAGILLSLLIVLLLDRLFVRPVRVLTDSARAIGEGNLDHTIPVKTRDELGLLAQTFNTMAAKLREYREAMTARVARSQRTMEATLTSTPDPLFIITPDPAATIRNPAAETLATLPEFARGLPAPLNAHVQKVLQTREHHLPTGYDQVITLRVNRDERHYLPRILYITDKLTGAGSAAMILQDVTKFRLLDNAKNNLVGAVSHELKTPLTSLRMAVYLLLEQNSRLGTLTPAQRDLLETARDDADRLLRLLNDILDLARLESGAASINRRPVNVRELLHEMAHEMRPITTDAGQRITVRVADPAHNTHGANGTNGTHNTHPTHSANGTNGAHGDLIVYADPERLRHVFINLLNNASTYSPRGNTPASEILLYAEPAPASGAVRFGVRDRGPGLSEADATRVFERFYRVPGQTRKGAGIGLTIAREIVLAHGGTIACASKPGEGSDFYFIIPSAPPDANAAAIQDNGIRMEKF